MLEHLFMLLFLEVFLRQSAEHSEEVDGGENAHAVQPHRAYVAVKLLVALSGEVDLVDDLADVHVHMERFEHGVEAVDLHVGGSIYLH